VIAIDTNVIVRYLVADEPEQFRRATALIEGEAVFVSSTVALEAEWLLRVSYRLDRAAILGALRRFAGLPTVAFENMIILAQALDWAEQGMDFADALHLAGAAGCDAFASFDRALQRTAARLGAPEVRAP
jgi:predicted nucleic-acid-binding protein